MKNAYRVLGDEVAVDVLSRKYGLFTFIVDLEDLPRVLQVSAWCILRDPRKKMDAPSAFYVGALTTDTKTGLRRRVYLSRWIVGAAAGSGLHVQHIDSDTLNNRRENLKVGSPFENMQTKRRRVAEGVRWHRDVWSAQIFYAGKHRHLGDFDDRSSAVDYYDAFRRARLDDPRDELPWSQFRLKVDPSYRRKERNRSPPARKG